MNPERSVPYLPGERRTTITVGTFDGFHRGHGAVLEEIVGRARDAGRASLLVTFEPHPLEVVAPERAPRLLTTPGEKRLLWPLFDLDYVHVLAFTEELRRLSPEEFVRRILVERMRLGELVIGYDHGFGKDRSGDVDTLRRLGVELDFDVDVVGPVEGAGGEGAVSSTEIRAAVERGDFDAAERGLGRRYDALGEVVPGAGRGRELGFPTANVRLDHPRKCLPPEGVYAVRVEVAGEWIDGMANLGPRPTFDERTPRLETHLLGWDGDELHGVLTRTEFVTRLRDVERFEGPDELAAQLERDREAARTALATAGTGRDAVEPVT